MPLLAWLARTWLLSRMFGGGARGRGRGGLFPFPHYSTRTRRGSRVSVSGCCLPIPLVLCLSALAGGRALVRR
jgi:hypothetical protein